MANPTSKQRLTKAERKEQARQERAELQRKMARSHRTRRISILVVLVLVAGAAAFALTRPEPDRPDPARLLAAAADARQTAGCTPIENVGPYQPENQDRAHGPTAPPLSTFPSKPPASGPHSDIPLGAGIYDSPVDMGRLIHSLEHGAAVVWYAPDATGEELDRIMDFYSDRAVGSRVIVAPYDYPGEAEAGSLDGQMALVAWHHVQSCQRLSLDAAFGFTARYASPPFGEQAYAGEAPEAGAAF